MHLRSSTDPAARALPAPAVARVGRSALGVFTRYGLGRIAHSGLTAETMALVAISGFTNRSTVRSKKVTANS